MLGVFPLCRFSVNTILAGKISDGIWILIWLNVPVFIFFACAVFSVLLWPSSVSLKELRN